MSIDAPVRDNELKLDPEKKNNGTKSFNRNQVDYDELLSSAGEFGRYQVLLFLSTFPFYISGVFIYYSQMFITEASANHWCWIPELENLTDIERRALAIPKDKNSRFGYSQCQAYVANWTEVLITGQQPELTWDTISCQNGWEFDKTKIPYPTITSDMGWVCDKYNYQATAQAIFFIGSIFGGFLIGWIADRFGRLPAAVTSNLIGCVGGLLSTFARNFIEFSICRFLMGMAYDSCMIMVYLLVLEYVAPKYRTLFANMANAIFYCLFETSLPWIALACGHWKTFSLVTSLPVALAMLTAFFIPESPRWLLSKGRVDKAITNLLTIGRINRKEISPTLVEQFKSTYLKEEKEESKSVLEIFKRPLLRTSFILMCIEYMCCALVFDGLVRSIGQLDFDFFLSFSVVSFTDFPSIIIVAFIMDWMGRRWLTMIVMTITCVSSILTVLIGNGIESVICAIIARFAVNMSFSTSMQWAAEILPTSVRGSGVSVVHICGYIATVLSPYVVYLKTYLYWLPLVVIGCVAGIGVLIGFLLPETAKINMPHTFEDVEEIIRNQKFWDIPCLRRNTKDICGKRNDSFEM